MNQIEMENCNFSFLTNFSWEDQGFYFSELSLTGDTIIAYSPLTQRVYRKKGIFEKGFCDKGGNWELYFDLDFGIKKLISNGNGCKWLISENSTVN